MKRSITPGAAVLAVITVLAIGGSHLFGGPTEEQIALATAASLADAQRQARAEAALLKRCHKQSGPSVELVQVGGEYECRENDIEPTPPEILRRYALLGGGGGMTVVSRAQVRAAIVRAVMLGAGPSEAIATVAQLLHLSIEDVLDCWYADRQEAV